jgi:hypothetical protein
MAAEADGTEISQVSARELGDQLLQRLLRHTLDSVPGAVGVGLSLVDGAGPRSVSGAGAAAFLDPLQWTCGQGPLVDALHAQESEQRTSLVLPDGDTDFDIARWPALADAWGGVGIAWPTGVVIAIGEWGNELPVILTVYTDVVPDAGLVRELDRFEGLLASALMVVEHCVGEQVRAEQMLQMVQYRRVIEQAKGLVMAATQADAAAAFTTLARASQHFNTRLRNLAIALVEHVGGSPAEGPEDPAQVVVPTSSDRRTAAQVWAALTRTAPQQRPPA